MKLIGVFFLVTMMILPFGSWAAGGDTPGAAEDDPCNTNELEGTKAEAAAVVPSTGGTTTTVETTDTDETDDAADANP